MKNLLMVILVGTIFLSCTKKNYCESIQPAQTVIQISIVDGNGNSLIGEDNRFKPSEITLSKFNQTVYLDFYEFEGNTFIQLNYGQINSKENYNFKLSELETDILNLTINTREGDCFDILEVGSFVLNGQIISNISNLYTIQK